VTNKKMIEAVQLFRGGEIEQSLNILKELEGKEPKNTDIKYNCALILGMTGKYSEEQKKYEEILKIRPDDYEAYTNLSISLNETKNYSESIKNSNRAIFLKPDLAEAYEARAIAKQQIDQMEEANLDFRQWIKLLNKEAEKDITFTTSILELIKIPAIYYSSNEIENKRIEIENKLELIIKELSLQNQNKFEPELIKKSVAFKLNRFYLAYQQKNDKYLNECYCKIMRYLLGVNEIDKKKNKVLKKNKKFGVISTFKYHPKLFIGTQLKKINKEFEKIIFIVNNPGFSDTEIFKNFEVIYLNITPKNINQAVFTILKHNIDVLLIPEIGMSIESQILAAYKLASITITSWLHPVTSGSDSINYYLSGELMETPGTEQEYTELLVKLPGIGLHIDPHEYINTTQEELVIEKKTTFFLVGFLQTPFKYHPKYDFIFVEIAKKIKNIKIFFVTYQDELDQKFLTRIKKLFNHNNLDSNIICTQPRQNKEKYLEFLKTLDIAIDSIGWSGGNTTLDCLGVGLPVLTISKNTMRSNHTSAIYKLINMDSLTFQSVDEMIANVEILNKDKNKLKIIKQRLLEKFKNIQTEYYYSEFINNLEKI
jgi:predicted O-linked N-acetylglucosamine transferase (SPINDLY family)